MADPASAALIIAGGAKLVGAYGSYQTGKIQQKMYNMKSRQALLRSDQEALNEKRKGVQVLEKILATQAAINARAGAGAIDPYSGTPQGLRVFATAEGMQDFQISRDNASLIEQVGILQSIDYKQAGSMAAYQGRLAALTQIGEAAAGFAQVGGAPSGGGTMPGGTASGYTSIGPAAGTPTTSASTSGTYF